MLRYHEIHAWDAIENTVSDVVVILPPGPRPIAMVVTGDGVEIVTVAGILRLAASSALRAVALRARTMVVAEADERIVRETLVPILARRAAVAENRNDLDRAA